MDFRDALNNLIADLTPQPWDYTTPDGTRLRVIPEGMREDPGCARVLIRVSGPVVTGLYSYGITGPATKGAAEIGVSTTDLPTLIGALQESAGWEYSERWGDPTRIMLTAALDLTVTEGHHVDGRWIGVTESVQLPESQRMPLASALQRALDVARSWES